MAERSHEYPRRLTRRGAMRLAAGAALGMCAGCSRSANSDAPGAPRASSAAGSHAASVGPAGEDALDEALTLLQRAEPQAQSGLSTHTPMVVEALTVLGHGARAPLRVREGRGPMLELPTPSKRIDAARWREALGPKPGAPRWEAALDRWADWRDFFASELEEAPWSSVVDWWTARLAPGLCAAATHGIIRTGHAARALARRDSAPRRAELARGLAYWAAGYQELPVSHSRAGFGGDTPHPGRAPSFARALEGVVLYADSHSEPPAGNIVAGLEAAAATEGFASVLDRGTQSDDVGRLLSELTATFARAYLAHGTQGRAIATVAFVHAVTGPAALRRLVPHVTPETARAALPYAWQAAAGIYVAYARRGQSAPEREPKLAADDLVARAIERGDDHGIKFTEALLAEHAVSPAPVYLVAAEDAVARL